MPEDVVFPCRIVPDVHFKPDVDDYPYEKFNCGDEKAAECIFPYTAVFAGILVDGVNTAQAKAACQRHSPVSEASPQYFNGGI